MSPMPKGPGNEVGWSRMPAARAVLAVVTGILPVMSVSSSAHCTERMACRHEEVRLDAGRCEGQSDAVGRANFARSAEALIVEAQANILQRGVPILTGLVMTFLHGSALVHDSSWSGSFVLPADGFLGLGGPYELVLEDGRSARVLVKA